MKTARKDSLFAANVTGPREDGGTGGVTNLLQTPPLERGGTTKARLRPKDTITSHSKRAFNRLLQYTRISSSPVTSFPDITWQNQPPRVLRYDPARLHAYTWIPFILLRNVKATVLGNPILHLQAGVLVGWAMVIHLTGLGIGDTQFAAFIVLWGTPYLGAVFNIGTLIVFVLGLFTTLVVNRWWSIRVAYAKLSGTTVDLAMLVCNTVRNAQDPNCGYANRARTEIVRLLNLSHVLLILQADEQNSKNSGLGSMLAAWRLQNEGRKGFCCSSAQRDAELAAESVGIKRHIESIRSMRASRTCEAAKVAGAVLAGGTAGYADVVDEADDANGAAHGEDIEAGKAEWWEVDSDSIGGQQDAEAALADELMREGLLNEDEWDKILDGEQRGMPRYMCVMYWLQALVYQCVHMDWVANSPQVLGMMNGMVSSIVAEGSSIFTYITSQMPYPYVHLVSMTVHVYLLFLATYLGALMRAGYPSGGSEAFVFEKTDAAVPAASGINDVLDGVHRALDVSTLLPGGVIPDGTLLGAATRSAPSVGDHWFVCMACYFVLIGANTMFQGLLDMHTLLDNPFGDHCAKFPLRANMSEVMNKTRTLLTITDAMPESFQDMFPDYMRPRGQPSTFFGPTSGLMNNLDSQSYMLDPPYSFFTSAGELGVPHGHGDVRAPWASRHNASGRSARKSGSPDLYDQGDRPAEAAPVMGASVRSIGPSEAAVHAKPGSGISHRFGAGGKFSVRMQPRMRRSSETDHRQARASDRFLANASTPAWSFSTPTHPRGHAHPNPHVAHDHSQARSQRPSDELAASVPGHSPAARLVGSAPASARHAHEPSDLHAAATSPAGTTSSRLGTDSGPRRRRATGERGGARADSKPGKSPTSVVRFSSDPEQLQPRADAGPGAGDGGPAEAGPSPHGLPSILRKPVHPPTHPAPPPTGRSDPHAAGADQPSTSPAPPLGGHASPAGGSRPSTASPAGGSRPSAAPGDRRELPSMAFGGGEDDRLASALLSTDLSVDVALGLRGAEGGNVRDETRSHHILSAPVPEPDGTAADAGGTQAAPPPIRTRDLHAHVTLSGSPADSLPSEAEILEARTPGSGGTFRERSQNVLAEGSSGKPKFLRQSSSIGNNLPSAVDAIERLQRREEGEIELQQPQVTSESRSHANPALDAVLPADSSASTRHSPTSLQRSEGTHDLSRSPHAAQ